MSHIASPVVVAQFPNSTKKQFKHIFIKCHCPRRGNYHTKTPCIHRSHHRQATGKNMFCSLSCFCPDCKRRQMILMKPKSMMLCCNYRSAHRALHFLVQYQVSYYLFKLCGPSKQVPTCTIKKTV